MANIRIRVIDVEGDFASLQEAATTIREALGLPVINGGGIAAAPALKSPPNEYTTAVETVVSPPAPAHAPAAKRQHRSNGSGGRHPLPSMPATGAEPKQQIARESWNGQPDDPEPELLTISGAIVKAITKSGRPLTIDQIWAWCQKNGAAHISKDKIASNVYAVRQQGLICRTPGTDGMGNGITWQLTK